MNRSCFAVFLQRRLPSSALRTSNHCFRLRSRESVKVYRGFHSTFKRPRRPLIQCTQAQVRFGCYDDHASQRELVTSELTDTIFALSSGAGVTAGVAIIRLSGPAASFCLQALTSQTRSGETLQYSKLPLPRYASLRKLYHPNSGELLDEAIAIFFPGPKSFTGEDVVEFHVHGSRAVINGVIEALESLQKINPQSSLVRPAERGEFTRRAFENGRMDLTSVEGLADLISAETAMQRRQALRQLGGEVKEVLEGWREDIKTCLAHAEAVIDFGDDVDDETFEDVVPKIEELRDKMVSHLRSGNRGEILRGGARIAIVGEPNAGKSTLLNALVKRPAAIVSAQAGTTRDVVEVNLDLNGLPVTVSDTAGLRKKTSDAIEIEGMKRARVVAAKADVTVLVFDASQVEVGKAIDSFPSLIKDEEFEDEDETRSGRLVCVGNKVDLLGHERMEGCINGVRVFKTSLLHNEGVQELVDYLEKVIRQRIEGETGSDVGGGGDGMNVPVITRARHRHHLNAAVNALTRFIEGRTGENRELYLPMDLATEDLRTAGKELGAMTGIIHTEEVLDVIFSEFCIGK